MIDAMSGQSYLELFQQQRELIDSGSCQIMNSLRGQAHDSFLKNGFPDTRIEEYRRSNVLEWFEPDWGMNLSRTPRNRETQNQDGAFVGSIAEFAEKFPDVASVHYGRLADMEKPGIVAFNTMFVQNGIAVYVPDGVTVKNPVQLISKLEASVDVLDNRRVLIVMGANASLRLMLCDRSASEKKGLTTMVLESSVGQGAHLEIYDLEETGTGNTRVAEYYIDQDADSSVEAHFITVHNGKTRNSVFQKFSGRGSSVRINGAAVLDGTQHVDNQSVVDHRYADCTSEELFKYVLDNDSVGAFAGKVLVRPGSNNTVSHQTNRNICLTKSARMFTQPQLEIYADDVKCSHGATVGQLDEKALFYMQQRGIPFAEARMLLMLAFLGEVLDQISLETLKVRLISLVEKRLRHGESKCDSCQICK